MKTWLLPFVAFMFIALPLLAGDFTEITSAEAKNHIGESVLVKGTVVQVLKGPKAVFLNFGAPSPNQEFYLVSPNLPFSALSGFQGKAVRVTGMIKMNNDKPEIVLSNLTQISEGK
jgi:hypothetical protein